jgi:hypothetical protein
VATVHSMTTTGMPDALFAGLRSTFDALGLAYTASPDTPQLIVVFDGTAVLFTAHPGAISVFVPIVDGVEGVKAEEAADLLATQITIDEAWAPLASYRPGSEGEVGLALLLPMPRRVSEPLLADALDLIESTLVTTGLRIA